MKNIHPIDFKISSFDRGAEPIPIRAENRIRTPASYHGFHNRRLLISLCAHMEQIRHFDLLKAFGYIERVIKSNFFSEKDLV